MAIPLFIYLFSSEGALGGDDLVILKSYIIETDGWLLKQLLTENIKTHNSVLWEHVQCDQKSGRHLW